MNVTIKQYNAIKEKYKDAILLLRIGDFYEAIGEDANIVSRVTGSSLQNSADNAETKHIARLPFHALDKALSMLVKNGYKVAICEELQGPLKTKDGAKKVSKTCLESR